MGLTITRKPGQRVFLSADTEADAAELFRQISEEGIWIEVDHSSSIRGQIVVRISAPPAVSVAREELLVSNEARR